MKASGASLLFEQKALPFKSIDAFFDGLKGAFEDGFVLARGDGAFRYFFVIQGKPYIAAVIDGDSARVTSIEDFFSWYRSIETADIEVYKADKKVLLCLLVRIRYSPELSFTTDQMAPEEVVENMEGKGKDAVIAVSDAGGENGLWHFVIFVGGKVAYTTLLSEGTAGTEEESPADRLISYIMSAAKGTPLLVEIYLDTKIAPASDAKAFEDGSITGQYLDLTGGASSASEAVFEAELPAEAPPEPLVEPELRSALEPVSEADAGLETELEIAGSDTLIDEVVAEDILPEAASPLELEVGGGAEEPFLEPTLEPTDDLRESGAGPEPEPLQEPEVLRGDPAEEDLKKEDLKEEATLSTEEPGPGRSVGGEEFPEELLEEVSEELTTEEGSFSAEPLPDEFAELSMEELSESFDLPGGNEPGPAEDEGEGEDDLLPAGIKEEDDLLTGNALDLQEPVKETEVEESGPEAGVDDPGGYLTGNAPVTGNAPEVPSLSVGSLEEDASFSVDEGFTFEDNPSAVSDGSSASLEPPLLEEEDIIEDLDDNGLDTAFDLDDSAGFTEDTPEVKVEESGGEPARGPEGITAQETGLQEAASQEVHAEAPVRESADEGALTEGVDEVYPEGKQPSQDSPAPKDSSFTPLPIEEGMGQRQPKPHPLMATLTGKDGVVFTLGGITNIGKEEGSEIKLEGMLASKRLAAIIRGKDTFKIVKKGGGKSALKVNGDKVDGELELEDGDTLEAGSLSLKFSVVKS